MAELSFPYEVAVSQYVVTGEIQDALEALAVPLVYRSAHIDGQGVIVFSFANELKAGQFSERFDGRRIDVHHRVER